MQRIKRLAQEGECCRPCGCSCPPPGATLFFNVISNDSFFSYSDTAIWTEDHWSFLLINEDEIISFYITCNGGPDYQIDATYFFGEVAYTFHWSSADITTCIENLVSFQNEGGGGIDGGACLIGWS